MGGLNTSVLAFQHGLRFYPYGQKKLTYSFGPKFGVGYVYGSGRPDIPPSRPDDWNYIEERSFRWDVYLGNYIDVKLTNDFFIGMHLDLGVRYLYSGRENYTNDLGDIEKYRWKDTQRKFNTHWGFYFGWNF